MKTAAVKCGKVISSALIIAVIGIMPAVGTYAAAGSDIVEKSINDNRVQLVMNYGMRLSGKSSYIRLVTLVPKSMGKRQQVLGIHYSVEPTRLFELNGNRYAEFVFRNPVKDIDIRISADILLYRYDLASAGNSGASRKMEFTEYLKDERYLEKERPEIMALAAAINGRDTMDTVGKLYDYVTHALRYKGYVPQDVGAVEVLCSLREGDCSDYSDALVALARAKNIPARTVDGFLTEYSENNPRHTWVEIYADKYGWVPFDPLLGSLGQASFDRLTPRYIYLSGLRNDPVLDNYHFFACAYTGAPVSVTDTYRISNQKDVVALLRR